jgi:hypothetical protein
MLLVEFGNEASAATFPMQADLYAGVDTADVVAGGSIGLARVPAGSLHARAAQITRNQGDGWNLLSRTHWIGARLGEEIVFRAGRLNLPFGLRIPEHTLWAREATRTDRESDQQHGISATYSGASWRGELMIVLGNYQIGPDRFRERGYSTFVEFFAADDVFVGASSLMTQALADSLTLESLDTRRHAHGVFGRVALAKTVVLLAEADVLARTRSELGYVGLLQVWVEPVRGLELGASGEVLESGRAVGQPVRSGFGTARVGGWASAEFHFLPQMDLRVDCVRRTDDPFTLLTQLHVYL